MTRNAFLLFLLSTLVFNIGAQPATSETTTGPAYDPILSTYDYPFEVKTHAFQAQQQSLEMAYMDVVPKVFPTLQPL